jgi:GT2 family glycosyltransferase
MEKLSDKLAILIPTRNRPTILEKTLDEMARRGFGDVPLWIYDDCSTDPAAIRNVAQRWPQVKVIRGEMRVGQAQGRNILMRACGREFALLVDDDSIPTSAASLAEILSKPFPTRRAIVTSQYLDVPTQRFSISPDLGAGIAVTFQGGGSLFHVPTILSLGGFRSFFIYGYEEPELAMRVRMNGYEIWYDPSFLVQHYHFETPDEGRDYREYDYLYARNSLLMSSLNMPLWLGLPHGLARSLRRSFFRRRNAWAKICGTLAGIGKTFSLWRERKPCSTGQALAWMRFSKSCS